jgi:hypothetical protein
MLALIQHFKEIEISNRKEISEVVGVSKAKK